MKALSLSLLVCLLGIALVSADDVKRAAHADAPSAVARRLRGGECDDTEVTSDGADALVTGPDEPTAAPTDEDEDEASGVEAVEESSSPTERRLGLYEKLKKKWNKVKKWYKNKKRGKKNKW
ncbi:unnamed protein product [Vitrella brassicaformis CCMP3155]|uniref:RxLR effector protein n=1 Tax=Vitrella brassicaformis (strain CCMP3155) TaxID=1169540 RepID=A0A0G4F2E0_VITBC|nr:unnamed protein product [Vitrella brassicaformis CCMP3155]|eukprot:CEM06354.1 unnamed protein product [Vitrella brassicaformis CCMP3155]